MGKLLYLQLWIWFCYISCHYTSGLQLDLTRSQTGDYFNNPYSTSCDDDDRRFCDATNSICYQNHPGQGDKCCNCRCQSIYSTFNLTTFRCAPNSEFRTDQCFYQFGGDSRDDELYAIDMTVAGDKELIKRGFDDDKKHLRNCVINKVEQMNSQGYEKVASYPFSINNKKNSFDLKWTRSDGNSVHGRVYRITLTCKYKSTSFTGCLMFKSAGIVQVYHPGLPEISSASSISTPKTTALSSSFLLQSSLRITEITSTTQRMTTSQRTVSSSFSSREEFIKPSSTFVVNSPSSTQWFIPLQSSVEEERVPTTKTASSTINDYENTKETMSSSSSSIITEFPTSPEKEKQSSKKDSSVMVYIIVIVVCVVIIALVVVLLFITKRKKKTVLKKRESQANIILSDMNKNNVDENEDGHYTSLDKSARNDESNYEALTFPGTDQNQPRADDETMHQNDNAYVYADTDRLYSTIVDDGKPGAKNAFDANENERVYSHLEQKSGQIDYTTQNKQNDSERVYSILEREPVQISFPTPSSANSQPAGHGYTGNLDVDYVTVVPPESEPNQSECSVYADLSVQRATGENQYQSLVKNKE